MSLGNRESRVVQALAVNFNQAANTVLLTFVASKPIMIQRFAAIGDAAAGLLAAMVLKLRIIPIATGAVADLGTERLNGVVRARGLGIYKDLSTPPGGRVINAGDTVVIAVSTIAGAVSTGDVSLEYWELPFAGTENDAFIESV